MPQQALALLGPVKGHCKASTYNDILCNFMPQTLCQQFEEESYMGVMVTIMCM